MCCYKFTRGVGGGIKSSSTTCMSEFVFLLYCQTSKNSAGQSFLKKKEKKKKLPAFFFNYYFKGDHKLKQINFFYDLQNGFQENYLASAHLHLIYQTSSLRVHNSTSKQPHYILLPHITIHDFFP